MRRRSYATGALLSVCLTALAVGLIAAKVGEMPRVVSVWPLLAAIGASAVTWWLQGLKWQWTLPLIPTFALLLALWNLQAVRKWNDVKHVVIMVIFGCASYAGVCYRQYEGNSIT